MSHEKRGIDKANSTFQKRENNRISKIGGLYDNLSRSRSKIKELKNRFFKLYKDGVITKAEYVALKKV